MPALSCRLEAVLEMLTPGTCLVDVGTDHGLVLGEALRRGLTEHAVGIDVNEAPLQGARRRLLELGLLERASLLLGDGLEPLGERDVDAVVVAGMSGPSIERICELAALRLRRVGQLVVQPNTAVERLRAWAARSGFHLQGERILEEGGRFFVVCAFAPASGPDPAYVGSQLSVEQLQLLGPLLLKRRDSLARRYYESQKTRLQAFVARGRPEHLAPWAAFDAACALYD